MISMKISKRIFADSWELLPKDVLLAMVRNHIMVNYYGVDEEAMIIQWCDENCSGLYRCSSNDIYFEEASDMLAFKLTLDGYKDDSK